MRAETASGGATLRTRLSDLLGIDFPIIQAGMGMGSSAELAVAVSNAGGLGSLGVWRRPPADLEKQLSAIRERTSRPFAMNHLVPELNETTFAMTLAAKPAVISFALGDPGDLVKRAHDVGSLVIHQVTTVAQARQAVERGVDANVAQGGEAGGYGGAVAALALVPQVVDAVSPIPVVAAGGYGTVLRALRTPFIDAWQGRREEAKHDAERLRPEVLSVFVQGRVHELFPAAGQDAGLIREIMPAGEIVRRMVAEARQVIERSTGLLR